MALRFFRQSLFFNRRSPNPVHYSKDKPRIPESGALKREGVEGEREIVNNKRLFGLKRGSGSVGVAV